MVLSGPQLVGASGLLAIVSISEEVVWDREMLGCDRDSVLDECNSIPGDGSLVVMAGEDRVCAWSFESESSIQSV